MIDESAIGDRGSAIGDRRSGIGEFGRQWVDERRDPGSITLVKRMTCLAIPETPFAHHFPVALRDRVAVA